MHEHEPHASRFTFHACSLLSVWRILYARSSMIAEARSKTTIKARIGNRLQSQDLRAYLALALGVVCIGFSAIFTKWAHVDGPVSGFYRVAIATVVLAIPFAVKQMRARSAGKELSPE